MTTWEKRIVFVAAASGAVLAACGGGGGGGGGTPPPPPTGAARASKSSTVALTDDDARLWCVNPDANSVSVFNVAADANVKLDEVAVGQNPQNLVIDPIQHRVYVVNQGGDSVTVINETTRAVIQTITGVGTEPFGAAMSPTGAFLYVTTTVTGDIRKIRTSDFATVQVIQPSGAHDLRGIAITTDGDADDTDERACVTEFLAQKRLGLSGAEGRDQGKEGRLYVLDCAGQGTDLVESTIALAPFDTGFTADRTAFCMSAGAANDTFCGPAAQPQFGFPNLLASVVVSGNMAYIPSISASPEPPIRFDVNVMAIVNQVDFTGGVSPAPVNLSLATQNEILLPAVQLNHVFPSTPWAGVVNPAGNRFWMVSAGSDFAMRLDRSPNGALTPGAGLAGELVRLPVGRNPRGIEVNSTSSRVYVMNYVSRDVTVIDASLVAVTATIQSTALPASGTPADTVLLGTRLFNASRGGVAPGPTADGRNANFRMSDNGWGSCFNCHPFGLADGVTWIFDRGPRQSVSLDGSFASADPADRRVFGWTAVRSSVQDFEKNTENVSGGFGLIGVNGDLDGVVDHGANIGLDTNADAIEAYVKTIRTPRGSASLDAANVTRGRTVFVSQGCVNCHSGPKWTRSQVTYTLPVSSDPGVVLTDGQIASIGGTPLLRDVGSFNASGPLEIRGAAPSIGQQAQGANGYNPPSLIGIATTAPYFHDGRFVTLDDVFATGHGTAFMPLPPPDRADLINFLRSIDETTAPFAIPP